MTSKRRMSYKYRNGCLVGALSRLCLWVSFLFVILIARGLGEVGRLGLKPQVINTSWMTVVTPADRPR